MSIVHKLHHQYPCMQQTSAVTIARSDTFELYMGRLSLVKPTRRRAELHAHSATKKPSSNRMSLDCFTAYACLVIINMLMFLWWVCIRQQIERIYKESYCNVKRKEDTLRRYATSQLMLTNEPTNLIEAPSMRITWSIFSSLRIATNLPAVAVVLATCAEYSNSVYLQSDVGDVIWKYACLDVGGGYATTPRPQKMLTKYEQAMNRNLDFDSYMVKSVIDTKLFSQFQ